jgi:hypothetical protein
VARHPAPTLGEHNMPVLRDILGLSQTEIDKLAAAGIYRNQGRTSQSPQGARGNWLIDIAFITHGSWPIE